MELAASGPVIQGVGEVVWIRFRDQGLSAPAGMGIKFGHISERAQLVLAVRLNEELGLA